MTGPVEIASDEEDRYESSHSTSDGRMANVSLQSGPSGTVLLNFTVTPDSGIVRKGITIAAGDGESYHGLMERVVDGDQDRSWEPGIGEALDLRGQQLTMFVKPTLSIYEPLCVFGRIRRICGRDVARRIRYGGVEPGPGIAQF